MLAESDQHALIRDTSIEAKRLSDVELHRCTTHRIYTTLPFSKNNHLFDNIVRKRILLQIHAGVMAAASDPPPVHPPDPVPANMTSLGIWSAETTRGRRAGGGRIAAEGMMAG